MPGEKAADGTLPPCPSTNPLDGDNHGTVSSTTIAATKLKMSGDCSHTKGIWKESSCRPSILHCSPQTTHPVLSFPPQYTMLLFTFSRLEHKTWKQPVSATGKNPNKCQERKLLLAFLSLQSLSTALQTLGLNVLSTPCTAACDVLAEHNSCLCMNGNPGFARCLQGHWWPCCDGVGAGSRVLQLLMMALWLSRWQGRSRALVWIGGVMLMACIEEKE